ncbi:MAG: outer membrane beta-barrel protein [bacterium]
MKKTLYFVTVTTIALALIAAPAWSEGWYVGGGIESVSFGDDLENVDSGRGFTFSFGYKFSPLLALDFLWGATLHDENLGGGTAAHGSFLAGGKLSFNDQNDFRPYVTAGLSSHAVDFDFFQQITGSGIYLGAGADIFLNKNQAINIGIRSSSWTGEDSFFNYDVTTSIFSVVYNYYFLK